MDWHQLFEYKNGNLYWKIRRRGLNHKRPVGSLNKGYKWIKSDLVDRQVGVHRVVWEMHNGQIPSGFVIDHIDRNTMNNSIENLRLATRSQNAMNSKVKKNKKSNLPKNVYVDFVYKDIVKYRAQVCANGKFYRVGSLETVEDAEHCAQILREKYHGAFKAKEADL